MRLGAARTCHPRITTGTPCSVAVGTSGAESSRFALVTARSFTRPLAACGRATESGTMNASTLPAATAVIAGAAPWKGTCTRLIPADCLSCSKAICEMLPLPHEA